MLQSEILKNLLNENHAKIKTMKVYSNSVAINDKINFISTLEKGIRGTCSLILDVFEAHVNTDSTNKNYMEVFASQATIAKELDLSREHVCTCINKMAVSPSNNIFTKIRQGLNQVNRYVMIGKKKLIDLLQEIYKAQEEERKAKNEEKQSTVKKSWNKKEDTWNNTGSERTYNYDELEKNLLGLE